MSAQGEGAQQILEALDKATTIEVNRLKLIRDKISILKELGMSEEELLAMAKSDIAKLGAMSQAIDVLQRHVEQGTITGAILTELPAADLEQTGPDS